MTKKKLQGPLIEKWFIELDSVIRHEILSYIVDRKANEEGNWMWNGLDFVNSFAAGLDCAFDYLDKLVEIESEHEAIELESAAGSLSGQHQAERFLEEKDFLIQVLDKNELEELSYEAQYRLTVTYPLAKETIKHYLKSVSCNQIPTCLRSLKLNEDFRINDLWDCNDIAEIVRHHLHVLDRTQAQKPIKLTKPTLVTSIKRNQYIDIYPICSHSGIEDHRNLELIANYKWGVINALEEPYRTQVLMYCNELVQAYMVHLSKNRDLEFNLTPEHTSLPVPPSQNLFVTRYDRYLPLLIGLYCIKNEHRYKKMKGREWEVEFKSFRDFLEQDLYVKFEYITGSYDNFANNPKKNEAVDLRYYINAVLSRSVKASIASAREEIKRIEKAYFSDNLPPTGNAG
jgi:hypothetical protein